MLEQYLRERREQRDVLLMTHIVIGYPDLDTSLRTVEAMVENGVDLMELQVPFSEPIADGPVILHANQKSLNAGTRVEDCFEFASEVTRRFDIPFIFMTYYNILYQYGVDAFVANMHECGLRGAIVPDLPPEEASVYLDAMRKQSLDPIFIYSPSTTDERLKYIAEYASGFVYCVARKGVTGSNTRFSDELGGYLARCRAATELPLAVGFGVQDRDDVAFLKGHADIAVVGSQSIRVLDNDGVDAVGKFVRKLV